MPSRPNAHPSRPDNAEDRSAAGDKLDRSSRKRGGDDHPAVSGGNRVGPNASRRSRSDNRGAGDTEAPTDGSRSSADPDAEDQASGEDGGEKPRQARAPWHFKVLLVGSVVYLGWRIYQGIGWLVHHV